MNTLVYHLVVRVQVRIIKQAHGVRGRAVFYIVTILLVKGKSQRVSFEDDSPLKYKLKVIVTDSRL
jgi:hypothetical protein